MRDYHFQPGNTESKGRPRGSANRRTDELSFRLKNRGDVDPADFCSQIVSSPNEPTELKLQAANFLLPYLYPKRGAVATSRYIDEPVQLLEPVTIEQANKNIAYISPDTRLQRFCCRFKLWQPNQYNRYNNCGPLFLTRKY